MKYASNNDVKKSEKRLDGIMKTYDHTLHAEPMFDAVNSADELSAIANYPLVEFPDVNVSLAYAPNYKSVSGGRIISGELSKPFHVFAVLVITVYKKSVEEYLRAVTECGGPDIKKLTGKLITAHEFRDQIHTRFADYFATYTSGNEFRVNVAKYILGQTLGMSYVGFSILTEVLNNYPVKTMVDSLREFEKNPIIDDLGRPIFKLIPHPDQPSLDWKFSKEHFISALYTPCGSSTSAWLSYVQDELLTPVNISGKPIVTVIKKLTKLGLGDLANDKREECVRKLSSKTGIDYKIIKRILFGEPITSARTITKMMNTYSIEQLTDFVEYANQDVIDLQDDLSVIYHVCESLDAEQLLDLAKAKIRNNKK